jgi:hypothetical protein
MTKATGEHGKGRPLCGKKIRYATQEAADRKLEKNIAQFGDEYQRVYQCARCDGFHVTTQQPRSLSR